MEVSRGQMKFQRYKPFYGIIHFMNKESLNPYQAQQKRIVYVEKMVGEGVLDKIPVSERNQNIALVCILNEEITGGNVGKIFPKPSGEPLTRERVRQIKEKLLEEGWKHASAELRSSHPLSELLGRTLRHEGNLSLRVRKAMEMDITDPKQLQEIAGSNIQLAQARKTLKQRAIEVPFIRPYANFEEKTEAENDDKKLQEMLDSHSDVSLKRYITNHRNDKKKVLVSLYSIVKLAGLHLGHNLLYLIVESIERNDKNLPRKTLRIEVGEKLQIYHIAYAKHQERIITVLQNDPNLQRFRYPSKAKPYKIEKD